MKRIVVVARGTYGDIHPFLAVASGLKSSGYCVIVAGAKGYASKIRGAGHDFAPFRPDYPAPPPYPPGLFDPRCAVEVLIRQVLLPSLHYTYADLLEICRGADLLLTHALAFAVPLVAGQLRIPWMTMPLQPMTFFSAYDPPYIPWAPWVYALRKLGPWPNRALRALVRAGARDWDVPVRRLREELGLPAQCGNALIEGMRSRWGTLALF